MGEFCLFSDNCSGAPCVATKMYKNSGITDFVEDHRHKSGLKTYCLPDTIGGCLTRDSDPEHRFSVNDERCINCMACVMGCPGNKISINNSIHPLEFCQEMNEEEFSMFKDTVATELLNGSFIKLPPVQAGRLKVPYRRFEDFTKVKETENIALWTAIAMKYLSKSTSPRIALEVGIQKNHADRDGRLDVSLLNTEDGYLFVAETKVSFEKMMQEGRYESQMRSYEIGLQSIDNYGFNRTKFLVVGGQESDLLHSSMPCSTSGGNSDLFYNVLRENNLFYASANGLLALALKKMFISAERYSLESIYDHITCGKYFGLLSCGFITKDLRIEPY